MVVGATMIGLNAVVVLRLGPLSAVCQYLKVHSARAA
jgi:hypothetical protein